MQDLHELQHLLAGYECRLGNARASIAALVLIVASMAAFAIRGIVKGGFPRFVTMFALGLPTLGEFHHVLESLKVGHYTPGTVTAVPSVICGVLFLRALVKEQQSSEGVRVREALELPVTA